MLLSHNSFSEQGFPDFKLQEIQRPHSNLHLNSIETPLLIVNFWASWCSICKGEMGDLLTLVGKMDRNLSLVNVSIDARLSDAESAVDTFSKKHNNFNQENVYFVWDKTKEFSFKKLNVSKVPEAYILLNTGDGFRIHKKIVGKYKWSSNAFVKKLKELSK